jgi:hypothetical protein
VLELRDPASHRVAAEAGAVHQFRVRDDDEVRLEAVVAEHAIERPRARTELECAALEALDAHRVRCVRAAMHPRSPCIVTAVGSASIRTG